MYLSPPVPARLTCASRAAAATRLAKVVRRRAPHRAQLATLRAAQLGDARSARAGGPARLRLVAARQRRRALCALWRAPQASPWRPAAAAAQQPRCSRAAARSSNPQPDPLSLPLSPCFPTLPPNIPSSQSRASSRSSSSRSEGAAVQRGCSRGGEVADSQERALVSLHRRVHAQHSALLLLLPCRRARALRARRAQDSEAADGARAALQPQPQARAGRPQRRKAGLAGRRRAAAASRAPRDGQRSAVAARVAARQRGAPSGVWGRGRTWRPRVEASRGGARDGQGRAGQARRRRDGAGQRAVGR
jgi:hypothetical protein